MLLIGGAAIRAAQAVMGVVNDFGTNESISLKKSPYVVIACRYTGEYFGGT
jgi:hypothetical protein